MAERRIGVACATRLPGLSQRSAAQGRRAPASLEQRTRQATGEEKRAGELARRSDFSGGGLTAVFHAVNTGVDRLVVGIYETSHLPHITDFRATGGPGAASTQPTAEASRRGLKSGHQA
jgi:hypothetical protein